MPTENIHIFNALPDEGEHLKKVLYRYQIKVMLSYHDNKVIFFFVI